MKYEYFVSGKNTYDNNEIYDFNCIVERNKKIKTYDDILAIEADVRKYFSDDKSKVIKSIATNFILLNRKLF